MISTEGFTDINGIAVGTITAYRNGNISNNIVTGIVPATAFKL